MMWDVGFRHVEYLCKLGLKRYICSLWVVVDTALLSIMLLCVTDVLL